MRYRFGFAVLTAALAFPTAASSQAMTAAAPVLRIGREIIKPGKDAAHTKLETAWSRALESTKWSGTLLALTSMSGPSEVWFALPYASLDAMQKTDATNDAIASVAAVTDRYAPAEAEYMQDGRQMVMTLLPELSYSTGRPLTEMRFLTAQRILVRAGHRAEFVESRTAIKAAHEKAKLADGYAIYQVNFGMPSGTYFVFAARKSLAELDDNTKTHTDPAYLAALGVDWTMKNAALVQAYEQSSETNIFKVSVEMSYAPKEWKDADSFWKPKAAPKKMP